MCRTTQGKKMTNNECEFLPYPAGIASQIHVSGKAFLNLGASNPPALGACGGREGGGIGAGILAANAMPGAPGIPLIGLNLIGPGVD